MATPVNRTKPGSTNLPDVIVSPKILKRSPDIAEEEERKLQETEEPKRTDSSEEESAPLKKKRKLGGPLSRRQAPAGDKKPPRMGPKSKKAVAADTIEGEGGGGSPNKFDAELEQLFFW